MNGNHWLVSIYCLATIFVTSSYCGNLWNSPARLTVPRDRPRVRNRCSKVTVPHGFMVLRHRGRVAKFTCDSGYKLVGDNIATCHLQKWDAVPTCVKNVECPKELPPVLNGYMIEYNFVFFKIVCNVGYKVPLGAQSIYPCEDFLNPEVKPSVCQLTDAMYCDFEKDFCGWNNTVPYFSWIRHQNATPSHELHTGPGSDHTTGTGHYLYIETSGLPDNEEKFAKLTHRFAKIDTPEICFVFWYHMYGHNIGTFDVYVDFTKVFTKSGNQGDKWRKGIIQKLPTDSDFYISLVATTANGFAGDIAIDDIGLVNSTDCTIPLLVDTTCKNRCFALETNASLCKCTPECLIEKTCCADFTHVCDGGEFDGYKSTTWETTDHSTTIDYDTQTSFVSEQSSMASNEFVSVMMDSSVTTAMEQGTTEFDSSLGESFGTSSEDIQLSVASDTLCAHCKIITEVTDIYIPTDSAATKKELFDTSDKFTSNSIDWEAIWGISPTMTTYYSAQHLTTNEKTVEPYAWSTETLSDHLTERSQPATEREKTTNRISSFHAVARSSTTSFTRRLPTEESDSIASLPTEAGTFQNSAESSTASINQFESVSHTHWPLASDDVNYNEMTPTDESEDSFDDEVQAMPTLATTTQTTWPPNQITKKSEVYQWKKTYQPKGRFKFSAVKSDSRTTTYVSILIGVLVFLTAATVAAYIFRKRRTTRFRDSTEESDVLYMTSDDILDFSIARRPTPGPSSSAGPSTCAQGMHSEYTFNSQINKS